MGSKIAGLFFPDDKNELLEFFKHFSTTLENTNLDTSFDFVPRAIISPHAGYIYSGFTANVAFENIKDKIDPKTIFVIGPSHRFAFDGCSIYDKQTYKTPMGDIKVSYETTKAMLKKFDFLTFENRVHQEHSTQTQMPFIKHYFPKSSIVEIIYSKSSDRQILSLIEDILSNKNNFLVISTDLSHFYPLKTANQKDNICLNAINNLDYNLFDKGCEACGILGVKGLVLYGKNHNLKTKFLNYTTSANTTGDKNSVVGYTSFVLGV
jgi:AmmeMemoRadiSam system protein B